ncbi:nuclear factor NF-kappa-B p105 subunit-like isoform X2 [Corticium candelabrum]|uniref:nuclear factor NF-kappa-B p105 subunit-like isoform X2 n=1 Tax=Corticium candelabrum TaxID=121492 RepID=UPI002E2621E7|nr:nuclear factor NF-kappa-B p105 subunit-like isoform X2 [Corticium candelabrum]
MPIGSRQERCSHSDAAAEPALDIFEQPKSRGFRFRYPCEGPSHGGLPGASSTKSRKSFPTVQLFNYEGRARIVVSLVTLDNPPRPHAHSLVGKNTRNGQCIVELGPEQKMSASFPNLGVLHETKKNVPRALLFRYAWDKFSQLERAGSLPQDLIQQAAAAVPEIDGEVVDVENRPLPPLPEEVMQPLRKQADEDAKNMNLSVVRLCFQAFLPDDSGSFTRALQPCLSDPVYDSKAPSASTLKICRLDRNSGGVNGGDEVFMLCDRVQKDDIDVKFFDKNSSLSQSASLWEANASFSPNDVHRQYAIVFKTPRYWNISITRPVEVFMQLRRRSDGEVSEPKVFTYQPAEYDAEQIGRKRKKRIPNFSDAFDGSLKTSGMSVPSDVSSLFSLSGFMTVPMGTQQEQAASVSSLMQRPVAKPRRSKQPQQQNGQTTVEGMDISVQEPIPPVAMSSSSASMLSQLLETNDNDADERPLTQLSGLAQEQMMVAISTALRSYATSNDPRYLMHPHKLLIGGQDDHGDTALHLAIIHARSQALEAILSTMQTLPKQLLNLLNNLMQTPLHLAVLTRQSKVVERLVFAGADLTVPDRRGNTPAHLACKKGDAQCLQALLRRPDPSEGQSKYPDLQRTNNDGLAPVHLALCSKNSDCLRLLQQCGADMNIMDARSGRTALHHSVDIGDLTMAGVLISEIGVDVDFTDFNGSTPLHLACAKNDRSLCALLVAGGADASVMNMSNETPPQLASSQEIRQLFEDAVKAKKEGKLPPQYVLPKFSAGYQMFPVAKTVAQTLSTAVEAAASQGISSQQTQGGGGLSQLDYVTRLKLALLLDVKRPDENDWRTLARKLGVGSLIEACDAQKSPTQILLQHHTASGGSLQALLRALMEMQRLDVITILQSTLQSVGMIPAVTLAPISTSGQS